jgi:hypothetical protein
MHSSAMNVAFLILSLGFTAGAAAQKAGGAPPPVPGKLLPSQYLPTELKLAIGGASPPSFRVEQRGDSLVYHVREFDPESFTIREVERTITPSAGQWVRFWRAMDAVDLWHWQPSYTNSDAENGTNWGVEIAFGDKKVRSSGRNAYPTGEAEPADAADTESNAPEGDDLFRTYLRAVEDLLGGARFH